MMERDYAEWDERPEACQSCGDMLTPDEERHCRFCVDQHAHEDRDDWQEDLTEPAGWYEDDSRMDGAFEREREDGR
jgi:hypothetical protein